VSARWYALLSAVLFSTGGAAIKATAWNHWQVAAGRSLLAAMAVAAVLPAARNLGTKPVWLAAVAYALTLALFVTATKMTTAANAIFLQGSAPLFLLLLGPWTLGEKVRARELWVLGAVAVGMTMVFAAEQRASALAPNPALGNALGAVTGLTWALTVLGLRWVRKRGGEGMAVVLAGNLLVVAWCAPLAWPVETFSVPDVLALLYLGLVQIALAYWCLTKAVAELGALETALLVMLEPALNPFWTWAIHGERPAGLALAGGGLILTATGWQAVRKR
jgi:drug/metabolite transporter (DMT)-like permease